MSVALGSATVHIGDADGWHHLGYTAGPLELRRVDTDTDGVTIEVMRPITVTTKLAPSTIGWLERLMFPDRVARRARRRDEMRQWARRKGRLK